MSEDLKSSLLDSIKNSFDSVNELRNVLNNNAENITQQTQKLTRNDLDSFTLNTRDRIRFGLRQFGQSIRNLSFKQGTMEARKAEGRRLSENLRTNIPSDSASRIGENSKLYTGKKGQTYLIVQNWDDLSKQDKYNAQLWSERNNVILTHSKPIE